MIHGSQLLMFWMSARGFRLENMGAGPYASPSGGSSEALTSTSSPGEAWKLEKRRGLCSSKNYQRGLPPGVPGQQILVVASFSSLPFLLLLEG